MTEIASTPVGLDFDTFLQQLENPHFVPQEFCHNPEVQGGFTVPDYTPPPNEQPDKRSVYPQTGPHQLQIEGYRGDAFVVESTSLIKTIHLDREVYLLPRLGSRRVAVQLLAPPEESDSNVYSIEKVYGVEPLFTGKALGEHPPESLLVEGPVVAYDPAVDCSQLYAPPFGDKPMPMVCVQLDPANPDVVAWMPSKDLINLVDGGWRYQPMLGDVIQVRINSTIRTASIPGYGNAMLLTPDNLMIDDAYIMAEGSERIVAAEQRHAETADLVATIESSRKPKTIARAIGQYIRGRYDTSMRLDAYGTMEISQLTFEKGEVEAILAAIEKRNLSPEALPIAVNLLKKTSLTAMSSPDWHLLHAPMELSQELVDYDFLAFGESIIDLTTTELSNLTLRVVRANLNHEHGMIVSTIRPLLDMLDKTHRTAVVSEIIDGFDNFGGGNHYGTIMTLYYDMLADVRSEASEAQQHYLDRRLCDAIYDSYLLEVLVHGGIGRNGDRNLVHQLFETAEGVVFCRNKGSVARNEVGEARYQLWVETSRHLLAAIDRVGEPVWKSLTPQQQATIKQLRPLLSNAPN